MENDYTGLEENAKIGMDNLYSNNFDRIDIMGPTIAHNININISNIIEDVKKQRMDIIRLNNELKNSRSILDRKNFEDMRSR